MTEIDYHASYEAALYELELALDALDALQVKYDAELHRSYHRLSPRLRPPDVRLRERLEPIELPREQTPS